MRQPRYYVSDPSLKYWYRVLNRKFFENALPGNVAVRWAKSGEEKDIACTEKLTPTSKNKYLVLLNKDKIKTDSIKLAALLHEMVHIATEYKDDHGPSFDAWHKILTDRGAFKKGAVLADITLF